jgi:hypothetical protein
MSEIASLTYGVPREASVGEFSRDQIDSALRAWKDKGLEFERLTRELMLAYRNDVDQAPAKQREFNQAIGPAFLVLYELDFVRSSPDKEATASRLYEEITQHLHRIIQQN